MPFPYTCLYAVYRYYVCSLYTIDSLASGAYCTSLRRLNNSLSWFQHVIVITNLEFYKQRQNKKRIHIAVTTLHLYRFIYFVVGNFSFPLDSGFNSERQVSVVPPMLTLFAQDITGQAVPRLTRGNGNWECFSFIHIVRVGPGDTYADIVLVAPRASLTLSVTSES